MKYILILILMLIPSLSYGDGVEDLRKAIDHEMQKAIKVQRESREKMVSLQFKCANICKSVWR